MKIPFGMPILGDEEKQAVIKVMESGLLVHGPVSHEFEKVFCEFTGAPHAVTVSSCTAGMHLIYFSLGFGPGDEVIIPAQTHVATAHAVELTGAKPVFIDCELQTGNIDIELIEKAITKNTRAIAVVHYLGVPVDMPKVVQIAKKHNLFLLEDCALAIGARVQDRHVGLHGDAGVFSFYPVKHMTTAEGGIILLKDEKMAEKLRLLRAFGVDKTHSERKEPGTYDTVALGFNYRMSEIHAAIGVEQVKKLPFFLEKRRENFEILNNALTGITGIRLLPQPYNNQVKSSHYCAGVILDESYATKRALVMSKLLENGIGSSVYYPQPVPRMNYYKSRYGYDPKIYENAATISDRMVALSVAPHINESQILYVAKVFARVLEHLDA